MSRLLIILSALARPLSAVRLAPRKPVRWPAACSGLRMQTGRDVDSAKGTPLGELAEKLNIGERIGQGTKNSWVNPAYWNRQFVTASHIANNVPNGSVVLELGKDAKNLYYVNQPKAMTLIVPPSNLVVQEGPIREAAAKLNVPFSLFTEKPLDTIPLTAGSFDAAIIFDMLDGAPQQACYGAISLLSNALRKGGRLLFSERASVNFPAMCREFGLSVEAETEGGFDVGIAVRRTAGRPSPRKAEAKVRPVKRPVVVDPTKGGFGASVGNKVEPTAKEKVAERERRAQAKAAAKVARAEARAAEEEENAVKAAAERAAAERAAAAKAAAARAAEERLAEERAAAVRAAAAKAAEVAAAKAAKAAAEAREAEEKAAAERVAAERAAAERVAAERVAAEKAAAGKAEMAAAQAAKAAAEKAAKEAAERASTEAAERARAERRAAAEAPAAAQASEAAALQDALLEAAAAQAQAFGAQVSEAATLQGAPVQAATAQALQDALDAAFERAEQVGIDLDTLDQLEDRVEAGELSVSDARVMLLQLEAAAVQAAASAQPAAGTNPNRASSQPEQVRDRAGLNLVGDAGEVAGAAEARGMDAASQGANAQPAAVAATPPEMERVEIVIPDGVGPGDTIRVRSTWGGEFDVQVPAGLGAGDALAFDLPTEPTSA